MANNYQSTVYKEDKEFYKRVINFIGSEKTNLEHNQEGQEIILECRRRIGYVDFKLKELEKQESSKP
jgi:hypothetical protein